VPDLPDRYRKDVAGNRPQPAFDPLGVRLGSFLARANGDIDIGYNSNLYGRSKNIVGDSYFKLRPSLRLASDWGRDSVEVSARAELTRFGKESAQNSTEYWLRATGLKEIGDRVTVRPAIDFSREVLPRGSAENSQTVGSPIFVRSLLANVAATYDGGQFSAELLLAFRRQRFEPLRIGDDLISGKLRDTNGIGARATLLYKTGSPISVLAQAVADDTSNPHPELGRDRSAHGYALLAGVRIDPSGLLAGQVAVGVRHRDFRSSRTSSAGLTYDARLEWYPTELITIGIKANQEYRNSGIVTANAVLVDKQAVNLAYEMFRDLNFALEATHEAASYRDVGAHTDLKGISLRATYTSRRALQLSAFAAYQASTTNRPLLASQYHALRAGLSARIRI
jgi:hypothetical protein